jgi:hypothetical protein
MNSDFYNRRAKLIWCHENYTPRFGNFHMKVPGLFFFPPPRSCSVSFFTSLLISFLFILSSVSANIYLILLTAHYSNWCPHRWQDSAANYIQLESAHQFFGTRQKGHKSETITSGISRLVTPVPTTRRF